MYGRLGSFGVEAKNKVAQGEELGLGQVPGVPSKVIFAQQLRRPCFLRQPLVQLLRASAARTTTYRNARNISHWVEGEEFRAEAVAAQRAEQEGELVRCDDFLAVHVSLRSSFG